MPDSLPPLPALARLSTDQPDFDARFAALLEHTPESDPAVTARVEAILADVQARGDAALAELTERFDRHRLPLEVTPAERRAAWDALPRDLCAALEQAHARIRAYAEHQRIPEFSYTDADGNVLGQRVTPVDRAGLYAPGGKAAYPSSVLMNAIPARVAGVGETVLCAPAPDGQLNPVVLAAAHLCGVDRMFRLGGAQAIAALAFGTASVPAVDKIVGPGNAYVAAAKRAVFGRVGIDAIAGPSEILVVADGSTDPDWMAMDLFSQAEHDEVAQAILLSPDAAYLDAVHAAMARRLGGLARADIVRASLAGRGALVRVASLEEACRLANRLAAEHLELAVADPERWLPLIRHAGAVFLGAHAPEAFGDYCAGPNHVLPTARAARFSGPLGTHEFQKRTSLIRCTPAGARALAPVAARLADAEGLGAHAASARDRL